MQDRTEPERIIRIHIEKLPEGVYLATSDDVQGLVAQGRTVSETIDIARDVARKLVVTDEPAQTVSYVRTPRLKYSKQAKDFKLKVSLDL